MKFLSQIARLNPWGRDPKRSLHEAPAVACVRPGSPHVSESLAQDYPLPPNQTPKVLLLGHFTTIGDLEVLSIARSWLDELGMAYDISAYDKACNDIVPGSVDWRHVSSKHYWAAIFICGPMVTADYIPGFFERFAHCSIYGLNLSTGAWLNNFSPFKKLWSRDDEITSRPDLSFLYTETKVPVVGVCLIHPQIEYREKQKHAEVGAVIEEFLSSNDFAVIRFDTEARKSRNISGLNTINSITSLLARCDVVISTRLHGMVLSLKQGVPVLAIDTVSGGAKVLAQAKAIGWPHVAVADELNIQWMKTHFEQCLSGAARQLARECAQHSCGAVSSLKADFQKELAATARLAQAG